MVNQSCAIIILAAGASSRFGSPKQLLPFHGRSLIRHLVAEAKKTAATIIVVTGAAHLAIAAELNDEEILIVQNEAWAQGIGGSISKGMGFLKSLALDVDAVLLAVCDQPFINAMLFNEMIALQKSSGKKIVACRYAGTVGTPVLFSKTYFNALQDLRANEGAKAVVQRHLEEAALFPFPKGAIDIDTQADYKALLQQN